MIVLIDTKAVSRKVSTDILAISANVTDTLKEYNWYVPLCQRHFLTPWWCLQSCAHARQIRGDSFSSVSCRRYMSCEYIGRPIFYTLYTVAVGDCVLYLYDFFLLSTFQSLISQTWLDRYWPDLVTSTGWPSHLCHMTRLGSKVT